MAHPLDTIHDLVVRGQGTTAREQLLALDGSELKRADLSRYAQLAWRLNLPEVGLRILGPIVRPSARSKATATPKEIAEYAHCLVKLGAIEEGERLLAKVPEKDSPEVVLCRVSALVARWSYAESIPLLTKLLAKKKLDPYTKVITEANLAAALVDTGQSEKAEPLLRELLYTCSMRTYTLLLGRVMELTAENFVALKKWDDAEAFLLEARKRLASSGNLDAFFVDKFHVINAFIRTKGDVESSTYLHRVKAEAAKRKHWETVRDCDRYEAGVKKNLELLRYVYFGTPYEHYRERLLKEFGPIDSRKLETYDWQIGRGDSPRVLDLPEGKLDGKATPLKPGSLLHRFFVVLASDFYRPQRLGTLFARLYPENVFDPIHSPPLLYNVMHRAREWIAEEGLPLYLEEANGFFQLTATGPFTVSLKLDEDLGKRHGDSLSKLRALWPQEPFSISQAQEKTGLSRRTLFRLLEEARKGGVLDRTGQSKATRYAFRR